MVPPADSAADVSVPCQTRCLRVYAMSSCGLGWLAGIAVSTGFAAEHRFGNYKNIYCEYAWRPPA